MGSKQTRYHPRLADDIGAVISKLAAKNGRSLPQELDFLLRPVLFNRPHFIVGTMPNGESADPQRAVGPSLAEEANGLRLEWDEKKKGYNLKKDKPVKMPTSLPEVPRAGFPKSKRR